jgi:hypothetical protein
MVGKWGCKEDGEHRIVKRLSGGGQIHSFLNSGGTPYVALYNEHGYECGSLDCINHSQEEAIALLRERWEGEHFTYDYRMRND